MSKYDGKPCGGVGRRGLRVVILKTKQIPMAMPESIEIGILITGPWKGVSGEGRARRGEPVIVVKKIDVHVHAIGRLGIQWSDWLK